MEERSYLVVPLHHGRPEGDSWNINAASDDDAVRILTEWAEDPDGLDGSRSDVSFALYDGDRLIATIPCIDTVECEACGEMAPDSDIASVPICAECAKEWDDDNARSYGPAHEAARIREARR